MARQGATTWTLLAGVVGAPSGLVVAASQLTLIVGCVLGARLAPQRFRIHAIVALSLVAGLALAPHVQDHDQRLLIPALVLAVNYDDLAVRGRRWYLALICVAFVVAPWLIEVPTVIAGAASFAGAVPFLAGITVLVGTAIVRAKRRAATGRPSS